MRSERRASACCKKYALSIRRINKIKKPSCKTQLGFYRFLDLMWRVYCLGQNTICCVSGLNYPQTRLDIVYNKVSENKEAIKKNLAATHESTMKKDVNFLDDLEPEKKPATEKKPLSRRNIMSKYL